MSFGSYLQKAVNRDNLSVAEAKLAMDLVFAGRVSTPQLAAFLVALRMKGETAEEVIGFAQSMRGECIRVNSGVTKEPLLDTCGTGGDGSCTFNISTVAALVIAAAGVKVAKHGNRSISSQCGSADILEELGVNIDLTPEQMGRSIREIGFGFLFAPVLHPAMKHAQAARRELKLRTVFNLLGPLTNPANATVQIVGAPSVRTAELMAESLGVLGLQRGFVVHGLDGMDEVTTTGETLVLEIRGGAIAHQTLTPADFGVAVAQAEDLKGDDPEANRRIALDILRGTPGPQRDIVLVNASLGLVAAGKAAGFKEGVALAAHAVDSGAAQRKLDELVRFTTPAHTTA